MVPSLGYSNIFSLVLEIRNKVNMTNQTTSSQTGRLRRYTISRLLELAPQTRALNFDLSKFTYEAARGRWQDAYLAVQIEQS